MSPTALLLQSHIHLNLDSPHLPCSIRYLIKHVFKVQPIGLDCAKAI